MLELARERLGDTADLHLGSGTGMPYQDQSFDLVLSMLVLHEMDHSIRQGTLSEIKRVLKDDGRVLLIDFNPGKPEGFEGWRTKAIIFLSEIAAGRTHFRNYRHFMRIDGLKGLIEPSGFIVKKHKVVGGGPLGLFLLAKGETNE
jgi:ubiquinone/menaquinone biosynthesis C-methylase UbiE